MSRVETSTSASNTDVSTIVSRSAFAAAWAPGSTERLATIPSKGARISALRKAVRAMSVSAASAWAFASAAVTSLCAFSYAVRVV